MNNEKVPSWTKNIIAEPWDLKIVSNSDNLSPNTCLYYEKRDQLGMYVIRVIDLEQKKSLYGVSRSRYVLILAYITCIITYYVAISRLVCTAILWQFITKSCVKWNYAIATIIYFVTDRL
jgi:hypothetical protein